MFKYIIFICIYMLHIGIYNIYTYYIKNIHIYKYLSLKLKKVSNEKSSIIF